jgi:hypothetical protein
MPDLSSTALASERAMMIIRAESGSITFLFICRVFNIMPVSELVV